MNVFDSLEIKVISVGLLAAYNLQAKILRLLEEIKYFKWRIFLICTFALIQLRPFH